MHKELLLKRVLSLAFVILFTLTVPGKLYATGFENHKAVSDSTDYNLKSTYKNLHIKGILPQRGFITISSDDIVDSENGENTDNIIIPDASSGGPGEWVSSEIDISSAPNGAEVTNIEVYFRCEHSHSQDIRVDLNADPQGDLGNYRLWDREGGSADDPEKTVSDITEFSGLSVNRTWYLYARDYEAQDEGYIDEWTIRIYYESSVSLSPPELDSPGERNSPGPILNNRSQTLSWESVSDAEEYGLYVRDLTEDKLIVDEENIPSSATSYDVTLEAGREYRWNMRAFANGTASDYSDRLYFQIEASELSPPQIEFPGNSDSNNPELIETLAPQFKWGGSSGADSYGLYVSEEPYGSENIIYQNEGLSGNSHTIPSDELEPGVSYRWNMVSFSGGRESEVSNTLYFQTQESSSEAPAKPVLVSPGEEDSPGPLLFDTEQTFRWNSVEGADRYELNIRVVGGEFVVEKTDISSDRTSYTTTLTAGRKYKWDMQAFNGSEGSGYSADRFFRIEKDGGAEDGEKAKSFVHPVGGGQVVLDEHLNPETNPYYPDNPNQNSEIDRETISTGLFWFNFQDVGVFNSSQGGIHAGEDWNYGARGDDIGSKVYATANGYVEGIRSLSSPNSGSGFAIILKHILPSDEIYYSLYFHVVDKSSENGSIVEPNLRKGEFVKKGELIARIGDVTNFGSHLHFEIRDQNWDPDPNEDLHPNDIGTSAYYSHNGAFASEMSSTEVQNAYDLMRSNGILDPSDFIDKHSEGVSPPPTGDSKNPSFAQISNYVKTLAKDYKVPAIIIRAFLEKESIEWKQFCDEDVDHTDQCKEIGQALIRDETGGRKGVGLTQVTLNPDDNVIPLGKIRTGQQRENGFITKTENVSVDFQRLKTDWKYNLKIGVRVLLAKKAGAGSQFGIDGTGSGEAGTDNRILENWYNALACYNGCDIGGRNDPGINHVRNPYGNGSWTSISDWPYQEAVFNLLTKEGLVNYKGSKEFPYKITVTLPGPEEVYTDVNGDRYNYVWKDYGGFKYLEFYIDENGSPWARESGDCGQDRQLDSECIWGDSKEPAIIHRIDNFDDTNPTLIYPNNSAKANQEISINNPGINGISFAYRTDETFAEILSNGLVAKSSGNTTSESGLFEYVFWLDDEGTVQYDHIGNVVPEPKRGYFVFLEGEEAIKINYTGNQVDPDLSLHRTMNMSGVTSQSTFEQNNNVFNSAFYIKNNSSGGAEVVSVDFQNEALDPGIGYFMAASEQTTIRPAITSPSTKSRTSSINIDQGDDAHRREVESIIRRVNDQLVKLQSSISNTQMKSAQTRANSANEICNTDNEYSLSVCFEVEQERTDGSITASSLAAATHPDATGEWEEDLDELQTIATPGAVHAYFDKGYGLSRSVKTTNFTEKEWRLLVTSASRLPNGQENTNPLTIFWDIDKVPYGKKLQLLDSEGDIVVEDMTEQSSIDRSVEESGTKMRFTLHLTGSPDESGGDGPDLIIENPSVEPERAEVNSEIAINYTIKNDGNKEVNEYIGSNVSRWGSSVYLSKDKNFSGDDLKISTDTYAAPGNGGSLAGRKKPGWTDDIDEEEDIPDVDPGQYYLVFVADDGSNVQESNEANNIEYIEFLVSDNRPDLEISQTSLGAETVEVGSTVNAQATIVNNGGDVNDDWSLGIYLLISEQENVTEYRSLASTNFTPSTSSTIEANNILTIPEDIEPGGYRLYFNVDDQKNIDEWDETNNGEYLSLNILSPIPKSPVGLSSNAGGNSIQLSWDANQEDDLAAYTIYRGLEESSLSSLKTVEKGETTFTDSEVQRNKTYYYAISATDVDDNESPKSDITSVTLVDNPPSTPVNLVLSTNEGAELQWQANSEDDLAGYIIYAGKDATDFGVADSLKNKSTTSYSINSSESMFYAISAYDTNGNESPSSPWVSFINAQIMVSAEWQLVSNPTPATKTISGVNAFGFDRTYKETNELEPGKGYWVKSETNKVIAFQDQGMDEISVALEDGWNLVGSLADTLNKSAIQDPDDIIGAPDMYDGDINPVTELIPNNGYWLYADQSGAITLNFDTQSSTQKDAANTGNKILDNDRLIFSNATAERSIVYFYSTLGDEDRQQYLLPPVAPGSELDVRTPKGYKAIGSGSGEIDLTAQRYPVQIQMEGQSEGGFVYQIIVTVEEKEETLILTADSPVILDEEYETIRVRRLSEDEVITENDLDPNFPNPFSSSTKIVYRVAQTSQVTLTVYDVIGRKVDTLVDEEQTTGEYPVIFNGGNLANGIYIIQLKIDDDVRDQKMTLIK